MTFDSYFEALFALAGAFISFFIGGIDGLMKLLVILVISDFITGALKGLILKKYSSDIGFHGISKKVCMFIFIGMANVIDNEMLGHSEVLRDAVVLFYLANEGLSVIENAIDMGAPVPDGLRERFLSWRNKTQNEQLTSKNKPGGEED